jgi:maltose phosphorylase
LSDFKLLNFSNFSNLQTNYMNNYPQSEPWCIVEEGLQSTNQLESELVFSIGNAQLKQRGNFEEYYSCETMPGSYISGNFYPENKTGMNPKNCCSVGSGIIANAPDWTGIKVQLNEEKLDLAVWEVLNFKRVLNLQKGFLERTFEAVSLKGHHIQVTVKRFLSMAETELGAISYKIKSINFIGRISFMPVIDGDLKDYSQIESEPIWNVLQSKTQHDVSHLWTQTRHTNFHICSALTYDLTKNNEHLNIIPTKIEKEKIAGFSTGTDVKSGDTLCLTKYVAILNSMNHPQKELTEIACELAIKTKQKGWNKLFEEHIVVCTEKWEQSNFIAEENSEIQQAGLIGIYRMFSDSL